MDEPQEPPRASPLPPRRPRPPLAARLLGLGARPAQRVARATGVDRTVELGAEEAIVRAIESPAVERAIVRVLQGPAVQDTVDRMIASPGVERALVDALDSDLVDHVWDRLLDSEEVQRLIERIAEAPEIRAAIASQGAGLVSDLGSHVGRLARRLDDGLEGLVRRLLRRAPRERSPRQAGFVSRAIAFGIDLLLVNGGLLVFSGLLAAVISLFAADFDGISAPAIVLGSGAWLSVEAIYLVAFWAISGQSPGMRFVDIRLDADGNPRIGFRRAVRRLVGVVLSVLSFGLGFLGVLLSERRRGLPDRIADTEVLYAAPSAAGLDQLGAVPAERR